jgi:hypothetical protein
MVATVSVRFDFGGVDGTPGTSTDVDALGPPCLRFKNADNATIDGNDKPTIPAGATIHTYWKSIYLYCDNADGHTLNNFRLYSDGNNGLGTGVNVMVGLQFPTRTKLLTTGYEVANNANELVAEHGGITTSASFFNYTSGAPLTFTCSEAGNAIDDTAETTNYLIMQGDVANTASPGDCPNEPGTIAYDEA